MRRYRKHFALCLDNEGNEAFLIVGNVYPIMDYLFARKQFAFVEVPERVRRRLLQLQQVG